MTDDISKVVPPEAVQVKDDALNFGVVQAKDWVIPTACGVRVVDERMAYGWNECRKATIDRLESATTPAEVDKVSELILSEYFAGKQNGVGDYWARDMAKEAHEKIVATLARQLAEAKAESDQWERDYNALSVRMLHLTGHAEQAESALAAATRRVAEVEGWISVEDRLPEDGAVTYCYEPRKGNQFVSQFHAEMPGGRPGWTEEFYERAPSIDGCAGGWGHWPFVTHWRPAFEAPPQLTKEPTK